MNSGYLLLHGFTGSPASFVQVDAPGGSIMPALAGHLDAPVALDFWSEVDRLAAIGAAFAGVFGYSLGGRLALGLLARHPERYEHAVIVSAHPGLQSASARDARRDGDAAWAKLLREEGLAAFIAQWEKLDLWTTQRGLPAAARDVQQRERMRHDPARLATSLEALGLAQMPDLRPLLRKVRGRVDVLAGARDEKFVALARELCDILPNARLTVVPDAGHNLVLERPRLCASKLMEGIAG